MEICLVFKLGNGTRGNGDTGQKQKFRKAPQVRGGGAGSMAPLGLTAHIGEKIQLWGSKIVLKKVIKKYAKKL